MKAPPTNLVTVQESVKSLCDEVQAARDYDTPENAILQALIMLVEYVSEEHAPCMLEYINILLGVPGWCDTCKIGMLIMKAYIEESKPTLQDCERLIEQMAYHHSGECVAESMYCVLHALTRITWAEKKPER